MKREISYVSSVKQAKDGRSYVAIAHAPIIEDNCIIPGKAQAIFGDEQLLSQVKVGMSAMFEA